LHIFPGNCHSTGVSDGQTSTHVVHPIYSVVFLTVFLPGSIPTGQVLAHFLHSMQSVRVTRVGLISEKIPNVAPAGQRYLQKKRVLPRDTMRITIRIKSPIPSGGRNNSTILAILTRDRHYRTLIHIREDHTIVKTGLYRYIRHPAYLGSIISATGVAVFFRTSLFPSLLWDSSCTQSSSGYHMKNTI